MFHKYILRAFSTVLSTNYILSHLILMATLGGPQIRKKQRQVGIKSRASKVQKSHGKCLEHFRYLYIKAFKNYSYSPTTKCFLFSLFLSIEFSLLTGQKQKKPPLVGGLMMGITGSLEYPWDNDVHFDDGLSSCGEMLRMEV